MDEDWTLLAQDLVIAGAIAGGIVLTIFVALGTWPPVVVVESGSMMHDDAPYGRIGTIDPGDLIFVRAVEDRGDVTPYAQARDGGPSSYGRAGDVVIFQGTRSTPVIHRTMAWVEIEEAGDGQLRYTVEGYGVDNASSIDIPQLGLDGYEPNQEGYLTKGDSPRNPAADQALGIVAEPVRLDQIRGKAVGELPWAGLIKLMAAGNRCNQGWIRVAGACAPGDIWAMFVVEMGIVFSIPLAVDQVALYLEERDIILGSDGDDGEDGEGLSEADSSKRSGERP